MSSIMPDSIDTVNKEGEALGAALFEAMHTLSHLHRARRGAAGDSTHLEARVLGFFGRQPGATLTDLAAHSGRDKGQLARLVGGLRERGLLQAQADAADGRVQRLHLTAAGRAILGAAQRVDRQTLRVAVGGVSAVELRQALAVVQRLCDNLGGAA